MPSFIGSSLRTNFNPRPPRGGRPIKDAKADRASVFQSTPSARRATGVHFYKDDYQFISIHALREEGDAEHHPGHHRQPISIHALREEGDVEAHNSQVSAKIFQSTPSARRATLPASGYSYNLKISIHALREEGDLLVELGTGIFAEFQSTPSARRATVDLRI